jgi:hypothetical protein
MVKEFRVGGREPKKPGRSALGSRKARQTQIVGHEQDIADRIPGGERQPASGALPHKKGDVKLEHFVLDSKETRGAVLTVASPDLTKIVRQAGEQGKLPGIVLTVGRVPATVPREWVAVPLEVFAQMVENGQDRGLT